MHTNDRLSNASETTEMTMSMMMEMTVLGTVRRLAMTVEKPRVLKEIWRSGE